MDDPSRAAGNARAPRHTSAASNFIGRGAELSQLDQFFQGVLQGQPHLVLINGEAGIGKTRFLTEVQALASERRLHVLMGRCHEDLALPYLPFIDSLFASLEQELTSLDSDVALIHRLCYGSVTSPPVTLPSPEAAGQEKLQLFLAISRATLKLAQRYPLVFIVDDLHWADQPSLDLFTYLVYAIANQETLPICLLGTHRPTEADTQLHRLIDRFEREALYHHATLTGLDEADTRELLQQLGLNRPAHQLLTTIHKTTQGAPLFIQEIVHHLVQNGGLEERGGYLVANASTTTFRLPSRVTDALALRLQALSQDCRRVLTIAAVLGETFSFQLFHIVSDIPKEELLDLLEEGIHHHVLLDTEPDFKFAHSLIRQAFYNEVSTIRRQRIHRRIVQALEQLYEDNIEAHIIEIAHHLVEAGQAVDTNKAMAYARQAGDQAFAMFAWGDAVRYYEAALAIGDLIDLSPQDQADLHYQAGAAHRRNQDVGPSLNHFDQAAQCYRTSGDVRGLAQALMRHTRMGLSFASVPLGTLTDLAPLQDVLEALDETEPAIRGHIAAIMADCYRVARKPEEAKMMAENALAIGQAIEDDKLCAEAHNAFGFAYMSSMYVQEALESFQKAVDYARQTEDLTLQTWPLLRLPLFLTLLGRLEEAESLAIEGRDLTSKMQQWGEYSLALSNLSSIAVARGHFDAAESQARETMHMIDRSHYAWSGVRALPALACAYALRGASSQAEEALDILVEPGRVLTSESTVIQSFVKIYRQLTRVYVATPLEEPAELLAEELMQAVTSDSYSLAPLCALIDIGILTNNPAITEKPYKALSLAFERGICVTSGWTFLISRVLGGADVLHRRWEQANTHFLKAIEIATQVGMRPELGRTYLDYATMLFTQDRLSNQNQTIKLTEQALCIFHELDMGPFAQRATHLLEELQPRQLWFSQIDPTATTNPGLHSQGLLQYLAQEHTKFLA